MIISGAGVVRLNAYTTDGIVMTTSANGTLNTTVVLPITNGGTNSTATATAGGIGYGTGTAHAYTGAGTTNQALVSNGAGAPTWATLDMSYLEGSFATKITSTATGITLTSAHSTVIVTATGQTITLPAANTCSGRIYVVSQRVAAATTTVASASTINGVASIGPGSASKALVATYQSDNSVWWVIGTTLV